MNVIFLFETGPIFEYLVSTLATGALVLKHQGTSNHSAECAPIWLQRLMDKLIEAEWCIYASVIYPSFVQIMACRLVHAKPLFKPMLEYR